MIFQTQQLNDLSIKFERLPAVSVNELEEAVYEAYYLTWERPLKKPEVACFLSHKKAWERVVKENSPMLVLEDDALLSIYTPNVMDELEKMHDMDYVTLEIRGRKKIVSTRVFYKFDRYSLRQLYQDRTGAAGYVLWPNGAKKLLKKAAEGRMGLADAFISSTYTMNMFQIEPAVIIQLDQCEHYGLDSPFRTDSCISSETKPFGYWKNRYKRITGQIKLGLRRLKVFRYSIKKDIPLSPDFYNSYGYERGKRTPKKNT